MDSFNVLYFLVFQMFFLYFHTGGIGKRGRFFATLLDFNLFFSSNHSRPVTATIATTSTPEAHSSTQHLNAYDY